MKILLDTNIIVDILAQRSPFFEDSFKLLNTIYDQNHIPCISASAVTDIVYILRKYIADKKKLLDTVTILIISPSYRELEERLRSRKTDTEENIRARLEIAKREMKSYENVAFT